MLGYNGFGELGNGTTTTFTVQVPVKNISTATAVTGGYNGSCALLSTSHVDCWGAAVSASSATGPSPARRYRRCPRHHPRRRGDHRLRGFCALLTTSHVDCWSNGSFGQLGGGAFTNSHVPVPVPVPAAS